MRWNLKPGLDEPDDSQWRAAYPRGLGACTFSSRAWLELAQRQMGDRWRVMFLRAGDAQGRPWTLPVLARRRRLRWEMRTWPIVAPCAPLEASGEFPREAVEALLSTAASPGTVSLSLWLPPHAQWALAQAPEEGLRRRRGRIGMEVWSRTHTHAIALEVSPQEHIAKRITASHRRHANVNRRADLELIENPAPALIGEYYRLYRAIYQQRDWGGPAYPESFFFNLKAEWEEGADLIVTRQDGKVVGGGVYLYDRTTAHCLQACVDREAKHVHPHVALYRHGIERTAARGLRWLDLGHATGNPGLEAYKESWGAVRAPVARVQLLCGPRVAIRSLTGAGAG